MGARQAIDTCGHEVGIGREELLDRLRNVPSSLNPLLDADVIEFVQLLRSEEKDFCEYFQALHPLLGIQPPGVEEIGGGVVHLHSWGIDTGRPGFAFASIHHGNRSRYDIQFGGNAELSKGLHKRAAFDWDSKGGPHLAPKALHGNAHGLAARLIVLFKEQSPHARLG